jgi:hypothetical protein
MQIDNYAKAQDLSDRLEATIPFQVTVGKKLLKMMRDKGSKVTKDTEFTVNWVKYSGDIGGINCALDPLEDKGEAYSVSITHLKIDPDHPLVEEVTAYQQQRIQRLKLQDKKGFAAEFLSQQTSSNRKPSKGFGK